ncbi:MAG: hypothetical protein AB2798_09360 [Candidatus Thiodiazotropha endolucinida]
MEDLPRKMFDAIVNYHEGDIYRKGLCSWDPLVAMS